MGCESDGQTGPVDAPKGADQVVPINADAARKLAFYQASLGPGVLAPRGWHCFGLYGSSGVTLYVTRESIHTADLLSSDWHGFAGPAVQASNTNGDTSGRFEVARVIARAFPIRRAFLQNVIDEGLAPAKDFLFGPYPKDKLIVQTDRLVQFRTPPHSEGLGTMSGLRANDDPVDGVAILDGPTPDLLMLGVRLPPEQRDLAAVIIQDLLLRQRNNSR